MIARKSLLIATSQFFMKFFGWIGLIVLAKLWGGFAPEALGTIGFAMASLALFHVIADLGFSHAHIKRVSEGKDLGTCIGTFATIKIFLIVLMVIVIFAWKVILNIKFEDSTTETVMIVFIFYYIFVSLRKIVISTFAGTGKIAKRQTVLIWENITKVPLMILVALAGVEIVGICPVAWPGFLQSVQKFLSTHPIGSLAMTYVLGTMTTLIIGMWFFRKYPIKKPDWDLCKSYFSFALPIMLILIISVISINIDKIMIGYFWTAIEVGYYFTVQQILQIILIFSSAISIILFPTFSEYHSRNHLDKIKNTTHLAERYISMIMLPVIVMVIAFATPIISIMLSDAFLPASMVLVVLTIVALITSLNVPYSCLISGINRPGIAAKVGIGMCVSNIIFNYLFIPKNGLLSSININGPLGAAIATMISGLVGFIGLRLASKKLTEIKLWQNNTPKHMFAGMVSFLVLCYINTLFYAIQWYHLIVFFGINLVIYISILYLIKEFNKKDLHFFLDLIHPKEMTKYILTELREK